MLLPVYSNTDDETLKLSIRARWARTPAGTVTVQVEHRTKAPIVLVLRPRGVRRLAVQVSRHLWSLDVFGHPRTTWSVGLEFRKYLSTK